MRSSQQILYKERYRMHAKTTYSILYENTNSAPK